MMAAVFVAFFVAYIDVFVATMLAAKGYFSIAFVIAAMAVALMYLPQISWRDLVERIIETETKVFLVTATIMAILLVMTGIGITRSELFVYGFAFYVLLALPFEIHHEDNSILKAAIEVIILALALQFHIIAVIVGYLIAIIGVSLGLAMVSLIIFELKHKPSGAL